MRTTLAVLLFSHLSIIALCNLNFYIGYGDRNDQTIRNHYMYNQSIGIYHRTQPDSAKFCTGKSSGLYSMGPCKNFYAFCDDDQSMTIMLCPNNEIYREEEQQCVDQALEPRCHHVQYATDHPPCTEQGHPELVQLQDCSPTYGVCHKGSIYFVDCPPGEAFSDIYGICVDRRENPSCYSTNRYDQPDHTNDQLDGRIDHPDQYYHNAQLTFSPLSSLCTDSPTDYEIYFGPCNQKYLLCGQGGYSFVGECSGKDAVMDGSIGKCVKITQSSACPANWPQGNRYVDYVSHLNTILEVTNYCDGKPNGMYYDPYSECRREGIFCFEGKGSFHICPSGQGIDAKGWCSVKESCQITDIYSKETWRSTFLTSFAADARLCQITESDGVHVFGLCQPFFGRCHLGQFEIRSCQKQGEVFEPELSTCVHPSQSTQCKVMVNDQSPPAAPINRCSSTDIDTVSKYLSTGPCQSTFLVCMNGWEVEYQCERKEHVFDEQTGRCLPKTRHPECPEYEEELIISITTLPTTTKSMSCQGDGGFHVHATDCTKFYRCAHGRLVEMSCPTATAFDPAINVCNHKHLVARCNQPKEEGLF